MSVVIHAAHLFESRHCPKGSFVMHRNHGRGLVVGVDGLFRWVKFETQICKQSDELEPEEFPLHADPQDVLSVTWSAFETKVFLHVQELMQSGMHEAAKQS